MCNALHTLFIHYVFPIYDIMSVNNSCSERESYLPHARNNLDQALSDALEDIQDSLCPSSAFVIQQPKAFQYRDFNIPGILFPNSSRAKEFPPDLYHINFGLRSRGDYHPDSGRIFLKQESWCRTCLIHETLHSVSIFAANIPIGNRYPFLREGLTELLTGYVIWRQHPTCYESWKVGRHLQWCAMSNDYRNMARIWYTFCRFVHLNTVKRLFFAIDKRNWSRIWNRFLDEINENGFRFRNPLRGNFARLQDRFLSECIRSFGRLDVERIYEPESNNFDFNALV